MSNFPIIPFQLFDSYKKKLIKFPHSESEINIYHCGPTVYFYAHIGNMQSALFADLVCKSIKLCGRDVKYVENITDVGHIVGDGDDGLNINGGEGVDKIQLAADREKKNVNDIVDFYTNNYFQGTAALNIERPIGENNPKASDFIKEQMEITLELLKKNMAYCQSDGVYFKSGNSAKLDLPFEVEKASDKVENAGELSKINYTGREIKNTLKNSGDFAIWKFVSPSAIQKWQFSPEIINQYNLEELVQNMLLENYGCPGWHSECVAMIARLFSPRSANLNLFQNVANNYLKSQKPLLDIHLGGEDHIPIHHKNEILQSAAMSFNLSKTWVHNQFVLVDGEKMSKSKGNSYLLLGDYGKTGIKSIQESGHSPLSFRLVCMEQHYQNQLNFTFEKLAQSENRMFNLRKEAAKISSLICKTLEINIETVSKYTPNKSAQLFDKFTNLLANNLAIPEFINLYQFELTETAKNCFSKGKLEDQDIENIILMIYLDNNFLCLDLFPVIYEKSEYLEIRKIGENRILAKNDKNYNLSDTLRDKIKSQKWEIDDYKLGFGVWKRF